MRKITGKFHSASGLCDTRYYIYTPKNPKAVVMLSHGMCEYVERYKDFARFLCENDIAFAGNDHIGHGNSVQNDDMLGYFGQERGYINMVRDLHRMKLILERKFPSVPHFLMGHSMGSFLARIYISKYRDQLSGVVLTGTAGGITGTIPLRRTLDILERDHGDLHRTRFEKTVFGIFNLRVANHRTINDWLSRDTANVDRFNADPKCSFMFTVAGYRDMLNALLCCNSKPVIENTPTDLPMLFLSGGMDPIGEYGNGVRRAFVKYIEQGCDANLRIYPEARHELIFELNRKEVMEDILEFLNKRI